ncbi:MAG: SDR family NAD(P)-dependent oxidoreductase [Arenicellales bacterium]|nr:SDR family NAD(P)-dependent oxidoreductase [Arenicellales bacterium]
MPDLDGRTALVTGGGSGIGAAVTEQLLNAGVRVTICGRRLHVLKQTADRYANCSYVQADVTNEKAVTNMFAELGGVDIVVINAGAADSAPIHKTDLDLWMRMIDVNLTGAYLVAREAIKVIRKKGWGRVVMVSSTAGLKGYPYVSAYCAAKHGVIGLTRSLAIETAKLGITVNAVCPGYTETPMLQDSIDNIVTKTGMDQDQARQALLTSNPMGRAIQPEEVASTVTWLCSEGASSITGQAIIVAGGEL